MENLKLNIGIVAGVYNLTSTGAGAYTIDAANLFRVVEADKTLTDIYANLETTNVNVKVIIQCHECNWEKTNTAI